MTPHTDSYVSRTQANHAGRIIGQRDADAHSEDYHVALDIARRWREQHIAATEECFGRVLDCFKQFSAATATYRLKRMESIINKLQRNGSHMKLGELDDIGGCRLILESMSDVQDAANFLKANTDEKFRLKNSAANPHAGEKNHIARPRQNGYRSYHLLTDIIPNSESRGCAYHIEIQLRTRLQHSWSTAVETASELYRTDYKNPELVPRSKRESEILQFFRLTSSLFAQKEGTTPIPGCEGDFEDLIIQLKKLSIAEDLLHELSDVTDSMAKTEIPSDSNNNLYLLKISTTTDQYIDVDSFDSHQLSDAVQEYNAIENQIESDKSEAPSLNQPYDNAVLIYATTPEQLKAAYPNYFTNISRFVTTISEYLH